MSSYLLGVDVGSASVRAAIVSVYGKVIKKMSKAIKIHNPKPDFYEQSTKDIWSSVCYCIREVVSDLTQDDKILGLGFDATCSLVVVCDNEEKFSLSESVDDSWDVIMWMDHRASKEAEFINSIGHPVLNNVGGKISVEMETPKLLWIKRNRPEIWSKATNFFDLADFLTWKATGGTQIRSLCTTVCKWTYEGDLKSCNESYFTKIGLCDIVEENFLRIGTRILSPGDVCEYLCPASLSEMGLDRFRASKKIPVAVAMIDAHAGALGLLAIRQARLKAGPENQLGLICGTSTCHMALSKSPKNVPGVWGPYYSAVLPGFYLNEGGQSAVGSLVDHILKSHIAFEHAEAEASKLGIATQQYLESVLDKVCQNTAYDNVAFLTTDVHILPDFHGNRSPLADPTSKGIVTGLIIDPSVENLALIYLATLQALAYGTKHIVQQLERCGHKISVVTVCGGLSKSKLFLQTHADVLGLSIFLPKEPESVLVGAAMLGACAAKKCSRQDLNVAREKNGSELEEVILQMEGDGDEIQPNPEVARFHEAKFRVFLQLHEDQRKYRSLMKDGF